MALMCCSKYNTVQRILFLSLLLICGAERIDRTQGRARIGVNWGDIARHPLPPEVVVKLLRSNNITAVKLFDAKPAILEALAGSGIEVMVAAPNHLLPQLAAPGRIGETAAANWVDQNLTRYLQWTGGGVNINYVAVGNEPFWSGHNATYGHLCLPALLNIQKAIVAAALGGKVFATIPFSADVLEWPNDPSAAAFRSDIAPLMAEIVASYDRTGAPFVINVYPFLSFPREYAFFGRYNKTDSLTNLTYNSMFDEMVDKTVAALEKVGSPRMRIVVGEVGWPSDGNSVASIPNAQRFNNELLAHLASKSGTPLRPNASIDVYLFSLLDENMKDLLNGLAPFERHWGIFFYDGTPKYPIDLSGFGDSNSWPQAAVGVKLLKKRYCVLTPYLQPDPVLLGQRIDFSCSRSDCTAMLNGSSCSTLNASMKASYAFNSYYQFNYQKVPFCNLRTLGSVVTEDPSTEQCKFPVGLDYYGGSSGSLLITRKTSFLVFLTCLVSFLL